MKMLFWSLSSKILLRIRFKKPIPGDMIIRKVIVMHSEYYSSTFYDNENLLLTSSLSSLR